MYFYCQIQNLINYGMIGGSILFKVKCLIAGLSQVDETDEMGFFAFQFNMEEVSPELLTGNWHPFTVTLLDEIVEHQPDVTASGEVRIITGKEDRIIVSDIDDTVLVSHSTQLIRKLRLMLFHNYNNGFAMHNFLLLYIHY